jgi:hypothetical protein
MFPLQRWLFKKESKGTRMTELLTTTSKTP